MLIPLVSVIVASRCCRSCSSRSATALDWPHIRTDDKASRSWTRVGAAGRPPPLVRGRRAPRSCWSALVRRRHRAAARAGQRRHAQQAGRCARRPGRARALGHRRRRADARSRCSRRPPRRSRRRARVGAVAGVHGAVAAGRPAVAARRHRASSTRSPSPTARPAAGRDTIDRVRTAGARVGAGRAGRRRRGRERGLRLGDLRQLPADDRADRRAHLPAAGPGLPLAAAAAQGGDPQRDQRRRGLGRDHAGLAAGPRLAA